METKHHHSFQETLLRTLERAVTLFALLSDHHIGHGYWLNDPLPGRALTLHQEGQQRLADMLLAELAERVRFAEKLRDNPEQVEDLLEEKFRRLDDACDYEDYPPDIADEIVTFWYEWRDSGPDDDPDDAEVDHSVQGDLLLSFIISAGYFADLQADYGFFLTDPCVPIVMHALDFHREGKQHLVRMIDDEISDREFFAQLLLWSSGDVDPAMDLAAKCSYELRNGCYDDNYPAELIREFIAFWDECRETLVAYAIGFPSRHWTPALGDGRNRPDSQAGSA